LQEEAEAVETLLPVAHTRQAEVELVVIDPQSQVKILVADQALKLH
jgi:hypothetical protein